MIWMIAANKQTAPIASMSYCPLPTGPTKKNTMPRIPAIIQSGGRTIGYTFLNSSFMRLLYIILEKENSAMHCYNQFGAGDGNRTRIVSLEG